MGTYILHYSGYLSTILETISDCNKELIILSPWFNLEGVIKEELESAIKRDVNITIITREPDSKKHEESIKFLLSRGVSIIYDNLLHAKLILADREVAIVGSANLQEKAILRNHELIVYSIEHEFINGICAYVSDLEEKLGIMVFDKSDSRFANPITKLLKKISNKNPKEENELKCPNCGGELVLKRGKFGKFYGCSNFPTCKYTKKLEIKE